MRSFFIAIVAALATQGCTSVNSYRGQVAYDRANVTWGDQHKYEACGPSNGSREFIVCYIDAMVADRKRADNALATCANTLIATNGNSRAQDVAQGEIDECMQKAGFFGTVGQP
jgi:hypothetical protein